MSEHNIGEVFHLSAEPEGGYVPSSPVKVIYLDGREEYSDWGSDAAGGGVLAWRAQHGDEAAMPYVAPPVSPDAVNAERDRRIFSGFAFMGNRFQSRLEDQKRIAGAGTLAVMAIVAGAQPGDLRWHGGDTDFAWIAEDNSLVPMDAHTVIAFGQAAAHHETIHVFTARALKDASPIPPSYAEDAYWPSMD